MTTTREVHEHCAVCVYYPLNLPASAYPEEDYRMLQEKRSSFDFQPMDSGCRATRKTRCSIVDMEVLRHRI